MGLGRFRNEPYFVRGAYKSVLGYGSKSVARIDAGHAFWVRR